ncbi:hypothetical protein SLEP1_g44963 [Rubroshorea leprosula]|uniref:Uncharacterized protein n=1 Tax=Rubroshorea leprosula TaxID=152421 RepID=A0AAV5LIZ4_9ROSI|nr:hypothetical protein SLEP1_g44963 [Rubroshorea leprosula]
MMKRPFEYMATLRTRSYQNDLTYMDKKTYIQAQGISFSKGLFIQHA